MVGLLDHCRFGPGGAVPSIDTPSARISPRRPRRPSPSRRADRLATAADGPERVADAFGGGSAGSTGSGRASNSACGCATSSRAARSSRGVVLGGHGVISWADTSQDVRGALARPDRARRSAISRSTDARIRSAPRVPGSAALPDAERRRRAAALAPVVRGLCSTDRRVVGRLTDSDVVLDFLAVDAAPRLAVARHVVSRPLSPDEDAAAAPRSRRRPGRTSLVARLRELHAEYRDEYAAYYERYATPESPADARRGPRHRARARRRHVRASAPTRRRRAWRASSTSTRSTSCAARRRSRRTSRSRIREVPVSSTGRSKRRSCGASPSRAARRPSRVRHRRRIRDRRAIARAVRRGRGVRRHRGSRTRARAGGGRARRDADGPRRRGRRRRRGGRRRGRELQLLAYGGVDIVVNNAGARDRRRSSTPRPTTTTSSIA